MSDELVDVVQIPHVDWTGRELMGSRSFSHKGLNVKESLYLWEPRNEESEKPNEYKLCWIRESELVAEIEGKPNPFCQVQLWSKSAAAVQHARTKLIEVFDEYWGLLAEKEEYTTPTGIIIP